MLKILFLSLFFATLLQAQPVPSQRGGTGQTTYKKGNILYADSINRLAKLTPQTGKKYLQIGTDSSLSWVGATAIAVNDTLTGDVTATILNGTGVTSIGSQKVTATMLKDTNVTYLKLQHNVKANYLLGATTAYHDVQPVTLGTRLTMSNDTINASGGNPNTYQNSPSDPTSTSNSTPTMMGLAGAITPSLNGKVLIIISGNFQNSLSTVADTIQLRYGTGSAPANGDAAAGTQIGTFLAIRGAAANIPYSIFHTRNRDRIDCIHGLLDRRCC